MSHKKENPDQNPDHNQEHHPQKQVPEVRYVPIEYLQAVQDEEDRIDLFELVKTVWDGRKLIVKTVVVFIFLGLFVALGSTEEFESQVKLLPETQQTSSLGGLGGLARQFGVNTGARQSPEGIPPALYPDITQSTVLLQRLMAHEVYLPGSPERVTVEEYMRDHQKRSLVNTVTRYTIGLPFTILRWVRGGGDDGDITAVDRELAGDERLQRLTQMNRGEWQRLRNLRGRITTGSERETGVVTITVRMQDPVIAADVADRVVELLSEYITEYRTEKFRRDMEFIEERHEEARIRYEETQRELARFHDQNRGQLTALARTEEQMLQSRYNLTFNLYNTMAERLEEARIKLQEETPVVNILEQAAVPDRRSEPKRTQLLILYTIFGGVVGVGLIFGTQFWLSVKGRFET
jgi:uncharacterized protein involved in exopolysaccharide biosynthesis